MKKLILFAIPLICGILFTTGCKNPNSDSEISEKIIGCWILSTSETMSSDILILNYKKVKELSEKPFGIKFIADGTLIERDTPTWSPTTTNAYADYSGNWYVEDGNIIIDVDSSVGKYQKIWKVVELNNRSLKIEWVPIYYEENQ